MFSYEGGIRAVKLDNSPSFAQHPFAIYNDRSGQFRMVSMALYSAVWFAFDTLIL